MKEEERKERSLIRTWCIWGSFAHASNVFWWGQDFHLYPLWWDQVFCAKRRVWLVRLSSADVSGDLCAGKCEGGGRAAYPTGCHMGPLSVLRPFWSFWKTDRFHLNSGSVTPSTWRDDTRSRACVTSVGIRKGTGRGKGHGSAMHLGVPIVACCPSSCLVRQMLNMDPSLV